MAVVLLAWLGCGVPTTEPEPTPPVAEEGSPPRVESLALEEDADGMTAVAEVSAAGGAPVRRMHAWWVEGEPAPGMAGPSLPAWRYRPGDQVEVELTPSAGGVRGLPVRASRVAGPREDTGSTSACEDVVEEVAFAATEAALVDGRAILTERATGEIWVGPDGPALIAVDAALTPAVELGPAPNGFDLLLTWENRSDAVLPAGRVWVGGLRLGAGEVIRRPIEDSSRSLALTPPPEGFHYHGGVSYPSWAYSPVQVLSDGERHVGVSVQHDLLSWRSHLGLEVWSVPAPEPGHRSYTVELVFDGEIPPGERRSATISVRVVPDAQPWLATLVAYRNHFRARYGTTRYAADRRPVRGSLTAYTEYCPGQPFGSPDNPYGWADLFVPQRRPDRVGWGPWADALLQAPSAGFARTMLWTPTGVFCVHPELNYPDQFVTRMLEDPVMAGSRGELARIPAAGVDLGLWWGRATLQTRPWDAGTQVRLDPSDPASRALALAELDLAVELGATTVGLDAFGWDGGGSMTDWLSYEWLQELQAHAPGVRFVTEGLTSDLVHTLAPTYSQGHLHPEPHLLADFLNPGHEVWGQVRWDLAFPGQVDPSPADREAELRRIASVGLVPVVLDEQTALPPGLLAEETWRTSVPEALRSPCDPR